jgi:hypothetical protein
MRKRRKKTVREEGKKEFSSFLSSFLLPHSSLPGSASSRLGRIIGAFERGREREREREKCGNGKREREMR